MDGKAVTVFAVSSHWTVGVSDNYKGAFMSANDDYPVKALWRRES
jgi:hypothetical protein